MVKVYFSFAFLFFSNWSVFAQQGVFDDYNHIRIPVKFEFQKADNEYQLNSLLRHLFKEDGFNAFMDKELLPFEYQETPCTGLRVDLEEFSSKLKTNIIIQIYDCENKIVFSSEGESYRKDTKAAYQDAIRIAFKEIESVNFSLNTNSSEAVVEEQTPSLSKEERKEMRKQIVREQSDVFSFNEETFYFFDEDDAIHIYSSNAYDIVAKLSEINETMFIFNSDDMDGVMTKKENGDFELEYRAPSSKETKVLHYKLTKKAEQF